VRHGREVLATGVPEPTPSTDRSFCLSGCLEAPKRRPVRPRMWIMNPAGRWSMRAKRSLVFTVVGLAALAAPARPAAAADPAIEAELAARPRIGLVLSGGGARG